jgi:hypothetical protein
VGPSFANTLLAMGPSRRTRRRTRRRVGYLGTQSQFLMQNKNKNSVFINKYFIINILNFMDFNISILLFII